MLHHVLAVLGLGLACGLWVLFQRWIAKHDPEQPGVESSHRCPHGADAPDGRAAPADACGTCGQRDRCGR